jgi:hypothetical protein
MLFALRHVPAWSAVESASQDAHQPRTPPVSTPWTRGHGKRSVPRTLPHTGFVRHDVPHAISEPQADGEVARVPRAARLRRRLIPGGARPPFPRASADGYTPLSTPDRADRSGAGIDSAELLEKPAGQRRTVGNREVIHQAARVCRADD